MKAVSLLATLSLTLGLAGAQTLVPFKDAKIPFTFSYPEGWLGMQIPDQYSGVTMVSGKTPPATMIRLVYQSKNGKAVDVASEFAGFEQGLKAEKVNFRMLSSREVSYGGISGMEREYRISQSMKTVQMRIWFGNGAKNIYFFQVTDSMPRFAAASALFSRVLETVKFGR